MLYAVLVVALVGLDQLVKFLVRAYIPLGGAVPFLPHILQLTYVQNTGAAFSLFARHTWLLTLISLVVSILLAVLLVVGLHRWKHNNLISIFGGTIFYMVLVQAVDWQAVQDAALIFFN